MSKKSLISAHPVLLAKRSLAIPFLLFSFSSAVWAQTSDYTWNTTMSFKGTGILKVSSTSYGIGDPTGALDPLLNVSMSGSGVNNASFSPNYTIDSAFNNTIANITIPGSAVGYQNPFSVTQPLDNGSLTGSDPGLTLTAPETYGNVGDPSPPFYGLFPPPAGQVYNGDVTIPDDPAAGGDFEGAPREAEHSFYYPNPAGPSTLFAAFTGPVTLKLGPNPVLTMTPDLNTGDDYYTYSYADSVLDFTATVGLNDPPIDFSGIVTITTVVAPSDVSPDGSVPDSSPGVMGVLALLGLCALGARQMRLKHRC
ncbi:MAG TPA: hypothetical protein VFC44_12845 [Candidatus Saccharimonadales bacterium]|nr:hypothetical protein [Candidatus Saccharimonadales bacterium]